MAASYSAIVSTRRKARARASVPFWGGWASPGGRVSTPEDRVAHLAELREFLHRFGRETNQEVVVVELSGPEGSWFFRIKEYDA
jgi:hypothetical protein